VKSEGETSKQPSEKHRARREGKQKEKAEETQLRTQHSLEKQGENPKTRPSPPKKPKPEIPKHKNKPPPPLKKKKVSNLPARITHSRARTLIVFPSTSPTPSSAAFFLIEALSILSQVAISPSLSAHL
jgi:hypothetical protein